ncbi:RidA family protein [candidate division KSB3 bacterium]|uniref:RidA family protein n=1 Tax=candidate division KSB3 bacterium TaxID=2044937 RepID=A0A9D5Q5S0_9BACT|nr:RidA family protein [candidate division KSB3 bacterium]MBD3324151.1 RidA family protein [candidate division KSB3 bacterium]
MSSVEAKLQELGYTLPAPWSPEKLERGVQVGNLVFTSGSASQIKGKLGVDLTSEEGYEAAQACGLQLLANLKAILGDLERVVKIVKLLAMVNSAPDFVDQPAVANGCTDLLLNVFGEQVGKHARSAVGMASLPGGSAIEIEMIVEVA